MTQPQQYTPSPTPAADSSFPETQRPELPPVKWLKPALLFIATVFSVMLAGAQQVTPPGHPLTLQTWLDGWIFAVPLMAILLSHEFGHYVAARLHRVPASLPYFIPMPYVSILGTMGAVIGMRSRISSRRALLDIGAAGPIAGMVVALPVLVWGLLHSQVLPVTGSGLQEGQCVLYWLMKRVLLGRIPAGYDVFLHPVAFAGWTGLFLTMINLLPVLQLDGGHIAYALLGPRQNVVSRWIHRSLPLLFVANVAVQLAPHVAGGTVSESWGMAVGNSLFWLVWFGVLFGLKRFGGKEHPPTEPGDLGPVRRVIAIGCMVLFVLLFMPAPMTLY